MAKAEFDYNKRRYVCSICSEESFKELRIKNPEGKVLAVKQGQRMGLLGASRASSVEVDVLDLKFYNLIRVAVQALEVEEKQQILREKDSIILDQVNIISAKNEQISMLEQQINILGQKISKLSHEQRLQIETLQSDLQKRETLIKSKEAHIYKLKSRIEEVSVNYDMDAYKDKLRDQLGIHVWNSLSDSSHTNIVESVVNYRIMKKRNFLNDYSTAGIRLGFVIESEIVHPFFKALCESVGKENLREVGGVKLGERQEYTIGQLPRLLSRKWQSFDKKALENESISFQKTSLYRTSSSNHEQVSDSDLQQVKQFIYHWQHPLSNWLGDGEQAASTLDQIRILRNRASHPVPLYDWHFKKLWSLIVGDESEKGLFHHIYSQNLSL